VTAPPDRARARRDAGLALSPAVGLALGVAATVADLVTAQQFDIPIVHAAAIAAIGLTRSRRLVWPVTVALVASTLLVALVSGPGAGVTASILWTNRLLAAGVLVLVGWLVERGLDARLAFDGTVSALEDRTTALEAINTELSAREEEIARQNEELVSQGEELERQSEELRLANDDLANRERTLAQLLELSRGLSGTLDRRQVLTVLCDTAMDVLSPIARAAAVLLRDGDAVHVACHMGFGDDEPVRATLSLERSFAGLVMGRGQPAYLRDLGLRPDIEVPQRRSGEPLRAVMGAPLWMRGEVVGTVEAYSAEAREWSEDELSVLASIAAQASLSLESAHLFEEVDRARRRFETAFRTLPVGVLVCDDVGCRHVTGNPAAAALFTAATDANFSPFAPRNSLVRRTLLQQGRALAAPDYPIARAVLRGEEVAGEEYELLLPGDRRLTVLASAAPIFDLKGVIIGGICAFVDITARKGLEREIDVRRREAEESSARKTRFLAAVSHDIRTPANAMRLRAELIKRTAADPALASRVPQLAHELQASAVSLVELVTEVLELTRFDSDRIDVVETAFSVGPMLMEECRTLAPQARARGVDLACEEPSTALWLRTDRVKLGRILGNLIENGLKFTEQGSVRVRAAVERDGEVAITVEDTGPGIPPEHVDRIFDEFFQLRNPERDASKGRGLGLAICKRLITAMGGDIRVSSRPGAGTAFTVVLPASAAIAAPAIEPPSTVRAESAMTLVGMRVLLVEDHESTRHDLSQILAAEGAVVHAAASVAEGLGVIRRLEVDVVVLDLMLPDGDGVEVLQAVRRLPGVPPPVLVVTGDSASRASDDLRRLGAELVLPKPVEPGTLLAALRRAAGRD
jgi:signal transduction histidine kinase/CheY-like chemotaxis protein